MEFFWCPVLDMRIRRGNRSDFSYMLLVKNKTFQVEIWKVVWTVRKYRVWMTLKLRKGDFGELKSKKNFPGEHAPVPPRCPYL